MVKPVEGKKALAGVRKVLDGGLELLEKLGRRVERFARETRPKMGGREPKPAVPQKPAAPRKRRKAA